MISLRIVGLGIEDCPRMIEWNLWDQGKMHIWVMHFQVKEPKTFTDINRDMMNQGLMQFCANMIFTSENIALSPSGCLSG